MVGGSGKHLKVQALAANPEGLSLILRLTWFRKRKDLCKPPSDFHWCAVTHMHVCTGTRAYIYHIIFSPFAKRNVACLREINRKAGEQFIRKRVSTVWETSREEKDWSFLLFE